MYIDLAKSRSVVGQRKVSCAATGKEIMSRVSPGLYLVGSSKL